jgi:hypothetical protein
MDDPNKDQYPGRWTHLEETACAKVYPCARMNKELFRWLDNLK